MHAIGRRSFLTAILGPAMVQAQTSSADNDTLTAVPGIEVGHYTYGKRPTGTTVVVVRKGAVASADVRGGAPGTREYALLDPARTVQQVHAITLSGGSAFGLAAADGVMRYLAEEDIGYPTTAAKVPIVPAAILYDLQVGGGKPRPDARAGYRAARAASSDPVEQGNVGAGAGATVGKLLGGGRAMKGGLGSAAWRSPDGLVVGALAAVNAVGDVVDSQGSVLAGARAEDGRSRPGAVSLLKQHDALPSATQGQNTTLVVVAANVKWTQAQAKKVAEMAHDGLAQAIRPAHTPFDGDIAFALGTGGAVADDRLVSLVGTMAAELTAEAVRNAVRYAESIPGYPAMRDLA